MLRKPPRLQALSVSVCTQLERVSLERDGCLKFHVSSFSCTQTQLLVPNVNQPMPLSKDDTYRMFTNTNISTEIIPTRIAGIVEKYAEAESSKLRRRSQVELCLFNDAVSC